jgi:hypothetical protein
MSPLQNDTHVFSRLQLGEIPCGLHTRGKCRELKARNNVVKMLPTRLGESFRR